MIYSNSAFDDLTKKENLDKINIDKRLIPSFVSVMKKMQNYFSRKGLMNANNYAFLFEKFLITDDKNNKFSIKFSRFNSTDYGCYIHHERKIFINNSIKEDMIESVLCHEFIHFLLLADRPFIENEDGQFEQKAFRFYKVNNQYGTFMSEAVTEYINKKIYPESKLYHYHVKMLNYMQKIYGNQNNMVEYLRSYIPFDENENFRDINNYLNAFQREDLGGVTYEKVSKNENFMNAQSKLLLNFSNLITKEIEDGKLRSVIDYVKRVYQLQDAEPIKTYELKEALKSANLIFLKKGLKLDTSKKQYRELYLNKLENIITNYNKIQNNIILEYEIQLMNEKIGLQIKKEYVCLVFDNVAKTFKRNCISPNKFISFKSLDKNGKEYVNELMLNIFANEIEIKIFEPISEDFSFPFNEKKLNHVENNRIKDLKSDIKFLETQKDKQQEKTSFCNLETKLEYSF